MESKTVPTSSHETEVKESQSGPMAKSLETAQNPQPEWTPEEEKRLVYVEVWFSCAKLWLMLFSGAGLISG